VPDTLAPPAVRVKVFAPAEVLIVAVFIALLNVAVILGALLGQTRVPFGVTESTVGAAVGEVAPPLTSASPHPAIATANRNAGIQILLTFNLRISFSCSTGDKAFYFRFHGRRSSESLNLSNRVLGPVPFECSDIPARAKYEQTIGALGSGPASY